MFCLGRYCVVSNPLVLLVFLAGVLVGVVAVAIGMWRGSLPRMRDERTANPEQPGPKASPHAS